MKPRVHMRLTEEDFQIWQCINARTPCRSFQKPWPVATVADHRDADAMLIMVEVHGSRVVQASTGDWCYFGHSSQWIFQNETRQ
jgi:hypothetical protein